MGNNNRILTPYDYFLIIGVIAANIIYSILTHEIDLIGSAAAIAGLLCVVLAAKGSIWTYVFGLVNVTLYAYISYKARIYGDAGLNALYYLPMQFIGWWQWRKRGAATSRSEAEANGDDDTRVKARRMNARQRILLAAICVVLITGATFLLQKLNDPQPLKDGTTTVLSIIAQALMAMAFMEQWVLWITVNTVSVAMWVILVLRGEPHAGLMVIMWIFYLLNSINGFRVWYNLSKKEVL